MSISDIFTDLTIEDASDDTCVEHSGIKSGELEMWQFRSLFGYTSSFSLDFDATIAATQF